MPSICACTCRWFALKLCLCRGAAYKEGKLQVISASHVNGAGCALSRFILQGKLPDYNDPVVLPMDRASVEDFCNRIHKTFIKSFKHALVWGTSTKHRPQRVRTLPPAGYSARMGAPPLSKFRLPVPDA